MDPIEFEAGDVNFYRYVGNDCVNFVDPSGLLQRDSAGKLIFVNAGKPGFVAHGSGAVAYVQPGYLLTDDGKRIKAFKYIKGDKGMKTDCHGATFGDGEYWINNDQVNALLKGDNYKLTTKAKIGDVLIYRNKAGEVQHSLTVTSINAKGDVPGVTGLGGVQTIQSTTTPDKGWSLPATQTYYTRH